MARVDSASYQTMTTLAIPAAPPSPRAHRVLGSALDMRRSQIATYERAMLEAGDVVVLSIGPPGVRFHLYLAFHPDGVQQVLAGTRGRYTKGNRFYHEIAANLGWGLLTSEGDFWQRQRRLIQPLFTRRQIAEYADLMAEEATAVADRWEAGPETVDAHEDMIRLTLRVVGRAIFGEDVDRAVDVLRWAFPVVNEHTFRRATAPVALPASWPLPANVRAARARRALYAVVDELIARRKTNGSDGDDLLARLLAARDADTGEAMDEQQVRDEALIFLLAGHETTSTAITFTLHLLGRHEDEQERVHAELASVLGGRAPTAETGRELQRTAMVVKEAMRLYPPAYATGRRAEVEDEIGGYRIPEGANLAVSPWATHRHPAFWDDPETFDPERFTPEREAERHPYAYFPFGRGPRGCIGSNFAMLEALTAVAMLVQRFRIRSAPGAVALDTAGITLRPAGAVPLTLTPR
jgi:cytochrome P450